MYIYIYIYIYIHNVYLFSAFVMRAAFGGPQTQTEVDQQCMATEPRHG